MDLPGGVAPRAAVDELEPLLVHLYGLVERKRRDVSWRSKAFLQLHDDPSGLHADASISTELERFRVDTHAEQNDLLVGIERSLCAMKHHGRGAVHAVEPHAPTSPVRGRTLLRSSSHANMPCVVAAIGRVTTPATVTRNNCAQTG